MATHHYIKSIILILLALQATLCVGQNSNWEWGGPLHPMQAAIDVQHIKLELELDPSQRSMMGTVILQIKMLTPTEQIKLDLIENYEVSRVAVNDEEVKFNRQQDELLIIFRKSHMVGEPLHIAITYAGKTPIAVNPPWQGGFTYETDANGLHWVGLSSQNEGAKIFMPSKDHPSDQPDLGVDLHITVPAPYNVAANGLLQGEIKKNNKTTFHWKTNYSTNNYGINFTMGDFVQSTKMYTTVAGNEVPMVIYLLKQNKERLPEMMEILELSLQTQEKYFGEYPFIDEKVGIVETPYLGMEHQTINAYGNNYRYTTIGDVTYDTLLYHELGHEWWGNKLGVSDWADFWIHEGFCAYADWLFIEAHGGHDAYLSHVSKAKNSVQNKTPIIVKENATSDEAYHSDIYTKGAFILHSLRYVLGDEVFFKTLKAIVNKPSFTYGNKIKTADIADFISTETGYDAKAFFDFFLRSITVPEVLITHTKNGSYTIALTNVDFPLPMDISFGETTQRMELSKKPITIQSRDVPVVDKNGWFLKEVVIVR